MKNKPADSSKHKPKTKREATPETVTSISRSDDHAAQSVRTTDDLDELTHEVNSLQLALRASQLRYQRLVQGLGERYVVFSYQADSQKLLHASVGFERLFGVAVSTVIDQPWQTVIPWSPGEEEKAVSKLATLAPGKNDCQTLELAFHHPSGEQHTLQLSASIVEDEPGQVVVEGLIEDITEHKLNQQQLQKLAVHDPLTGLFNRRYLNTRLAEEIQRAQRYSRSLALLHLDLDQLKHINDSHGHDMGDRVLKSVAAVLQNTTRPADLAARLDDDQFVLVLPETSADTACDMGGRLCQTIAACGASLDGETLPVVRASIGVAAYPDHATTPEDMMTAAATAMRQSKLVGGNRVTRAGID